MKSGIIIFNIILLLLIGVLFYLHFSASPKNKVIAPAATNSKAAPTDASFKIAYFEMDSLENSFAMVKDVKSEISKREVSINNELTRLEKLYRDKASRYQSQAATMNQVQSEAATKDMMAMQQQMQSKKQGLEQDLQDFSMRKLKDIKWKIETYLETYNNTKGYSYIFAYEPGLFYYRDTAYNITGDVIKGLNETYKKN